MEKCPNIRQLKKALGKEYSIRTIDLERCLYRDFGNGFNVEISGVSRANSRGPATLYLWHGENAPYCIIVKTIRGVGRSAEAIQRPLSIRLTRMIALWQTEKLSPNLGLS